MNKLIYLLFCFLFVCCSNNSKHNEVEIFNGLKFKLQEAEVQENINDVTKKNYFSFFGKNKNQLPLFKFIKSKNYEIYIGLPFKTSIPKLLSNSISVNDSSVIILNSDSVSFMFRKSKLNNNYITEFAKQYDANIIYLLCVSNSKFVSDSVFSFEKLSKRIAL